ncbi:MAG: carboxypeptidase regulatory-like domain-containing protein [Gemmatimonadales bacterium]
MRRLNLVVGLSVACLFTAHCDSMGGDSTAPEQVARVPVNPPGATIGVGETATFTAQALDANDNVLSGKSFTFSSSNTAVATVADPAANPATVSAVAAGSATITATVEGRTGTAQLTVTATPDIQVQGRVVDGETGAGIASATVDFQTESEGASGSTLTGGDGSFSFAVPFPDAVDMTASATGYVSTTLFNASVSPPSTQIQTILLVRQTSMKGSISGTVRNARTNQGIQQAGVRLLKGQDALGLAFSETTSDANGGFTFNQLDAGTYTLSAKADGFSFGRRTAIPVVSGAVVAQDVILAPEGTNQIVIVLTWGATPSDLDAHLTGPNPDGSRFHVYYPPGSRGSFTGPPFAGLDVDDTDSFGPETITITQFSSGTYRYSVHDFSNRSSATSTALGTSGARVELYGGIRGTEIFFVPNQRGTLWTVFELSGDIANPTITPRNMMGLAEDPGGILIRAPRAAEGGKGGETDASLIGRAIRTLQKAKGR